MDCPMRRGDIHLTDFEPVVGSVANKRRLAVIVSNDRANVAAVEQGRGVVTVVPVASNARKVYPFQTLLLAAETRLAVDSEAQAEQVRSVNVERIGAAIARVPADVMAHLDNALSAASRPLIARPAARSPRSFMLHASSGWHANVS